MRVLVCDASILIELEKRSQLEDIFRLPFKFAVPDALWKDELIRLGEVDHNALQRRGLRVATLDAEALAQGLAYQAAWPELTIHDCFALTLAVRNGWTLLTTDRGLKTLAKEARIEVHDESWFADRPAKAGATAKKSPTPLVIPEACHTLTFQRRQQAMRRRLRVQRADMKPHSNVKGFEWTMPKT